MSDRDIEYRKLIIEKNKLYIEIWKLMATILVPIAGIIAILIQLNSQKNLKHTELSFQGQMEEKRFIFQKQMEKEKQELNLFLSILQSEDSDSLLRKSVSVGALDDSKKRYSFLLEDTIRVLKPRGRASAFEGPLKVRSVSSLLRTNIQDPCGAAEVDNVNAYIYTNGEIEYSFDIRALMTMKNMVLEVTLKDQDEDSITQVIFPPIDISTVIEAYSDNKSKRMIYRAYDKRIEEYFNEIGWTFLNWRCDN